MRGQDLRLLPAGCSAVLGTWWALRFPVSWEFCLGEGLGASILACVLLALGRKTGAEEHYVEIRGARGGCGSSGILRRSLPRLLSNIGVAFLSFLVAVSITGGRVNLYFPEEVTKPATAHRSVRGEAIVSAKPSCRQRFGHEECEVRAHVLTLMTDTPFHVSSHLPLLLLQGVPNDILSGQHFTFTGRLAEPWRGRLVVRVHMGHIRGSGELEARIVRCIDTAVRRLIEPYPSHAHGLIPGVALGDDSGVEGELETAMRRSSLVHLTAVSGGHVSILLTGVVVLCGRRRGWLCALGGSGMMYGLVALVGPHPSVLRAVLMGIVVLVGIGIRRSSSAAVALSVALITMAFLDPWTATSVGFLLSALATGAIILVGRVLAAHLEAYIPRILADLLAIPLSAQLACTPILALLSPQASLWSVVANMVVAPVVGILTILGLAGALLSPITDSISQICFSVAGVCTWWIEKVAFALQFLPGSDVPVWKGGVAFLLTAAVILAL